METLLAFDLTSACGTDPGFVCEVVYDFTENEDIAEVADALVPFFRAGAILFVAWILTRVVARIIDGTVQRLLPPEEDLANDDPTHESTDEADDEADDEASEALLRRTEALRALDLRRSQRRQEHDERSRQRTQALGTVLKSLSNLVLWTIAAFMTLGEFDINLGPLIASAGIVGIALGFGAQSLVKDFLSGIFMLVEDQYGVGDIVDVGDAAGVVEEVKLRTTKIRDVQGTLWHIPNGEIRRVANKSQEWARAVLDVEVAYDTDIPHAMAVIKQAADSVWDDALENATVLEEPEIWGVETFGASSIAIRLVLKVEPAEQFAVAREVRRRLKAAFDEAGIEIPFPQRTVWMHQVPIEPEQRERSGPEVMEFQPKAAPEGEFDA